MCAVTSSHRRYGAPDDPKQPAVHDQSRRLSWSVRANMSYPRTLPLTVPTSYPSGKNFNRILTEVMSAGTEADRILETNSEPRSASLSYPDLAWPAVRTSKGRPVFSRERSRATPDGRKRPRARIGVGGSFSRSPITWRRYRWSRVLHCACPDPVHHS